MRKSLQLFRRKKSLVYSLDFDRNYHMNLQNINVKKYQWVVANEDNTSEIFNNMPKRKETFISFLKLGYVGVYIYNEKDWISYGWISTKQSLGPPQFSSFIKKKPVYWLFYSRTNDKYRGKGFHKLSMYLRLQLLEEKNNGSQETVYTDTTSNNIASRKGMVYLGFEPSGIINTFTFWRRYKVSMWNRGGKHPN